MAKLIGKQCGYVLMLWTAFFMYTFHISNIIFPKEHLSDFVYIQHTPNINSSIFMWFEQSMYHEDHIGSRGQESYSFANPTDIVIGYNYANMDKDWFLWLLKLNNLSPTQFYWIQDTRFKESLQAKYMLNDTNFIQQISLIISNKITNNECDTVIIRPLYQKVGLPLLINKIRSHFPSTVTNSAVITGIADQVWMQKFGTKACLHRHIDNIDKPSLVQFVNIFNQHDGLTELKGYICKNKDEILFAFDRLTQEIGHNNVVIKDCDGSSGKDISFYKNKQDITNKFVWKKSFKLVTIEQDLRYANTAIESIEFVGISFYDNELIGGGHKQIIEHGSEFVGSETYLNAHIEQRLRNITKFDVMEKIGTKFMGGFDYAIQIFKDKNILPKIYLIDFNTGRPTGTTQTFIVVNKFDIKGKYFMRLNVEINSDASFETLTQMYSKLLFDKKTKKGIYFHSFYPKRQHAIVSIFGDNKTEAYELYKQLKNMKIYKTV